MNAMAKVKNTSLLHMPNTFFGKNLKFLRKSNGLSQTDLGKNLGLNRNNIASYESGLAEPNIKNLIVICTFFDIELREMLEVDLTATNPLTETKPSLHSKEINQFITKTQEITKISDSYQYFIEMIKNDGDDSSDEYLLGYLGDLMNVLKKLLKLNDELIGSIYENSDFK